MRVVRFDKIILDLLIECGFEYCYSRTSADEHIPDQFKILLTPVKGKPDIHQMPLTYDTFFNIKKEPTQMAAEIDDDTTVYVNLNDTLMKYVYE